MANSSEFFKVEVVDCNVEKKRPETRFLCLHSCVGADWERRCTALNILKEEKMKRTGKNALEPDHHLPAKMCFSKFMRILQLYNEELYIMHIIYGVLLILLIESSYAGHILHISDRVSWGSFLRMLVQVLRLLSPNNHSFQTLQYFFWFPVLFL